MVNKGIGVKQASTLFIALSCIALASIGGADNVGKRGTSIANQEPFFAPVPKAVCGPGDKPETGLQGQVPAALRASGFQGFSCNLKLLAQVRGEGANWQTTEWREGRGKNRKVCGYHGTSHPTAPPMLPRMNYGVRAIDISDPTKPYNTAYLTTTSMLDPWESLKVNQRRKLLGAGNGANGGGPANMDIYDVSGDCRYPQLLASHMLGQDDGYGGLIRAGLTGHEGSWAPDGLTYYTRGSNYYAVDTTDTTKPKVISIWTNPIGGGYHGLSVSDDGKRGYFISTGTANIATLTDPAVTNTNGLLIFDLTNIQNRTGGVNPQPPLVSSLTWKDGAGAQHSILATIAKKPYVIFVDESGTSGNGVATRQVVCDLGFIPFPLARIIDISDETKPKVVSKLMLETHDPANCAKVVPDLTGETSFTYGSHYCSVDNYHKATTLACGYFFSGIRVFDIRDPYRPREIAYYNPAGTTTASSGSNRAGRGWYAGSPDWCAAQVHLDVEQGTLWTTCQDNGMLSLQFTHNAWPFADSSTPPGTQNN